MRESLITNFLSIIFAVGGISIAIVARATLGKNWSGQIDFKKDHELITTGIYGYMRHPIYTGFLLLLSGFVFSTLTLGTCMLFLLVFLFLLYKLKQEEAFMVEHFPTEYTAYKKRVKALIPFFL